MKHQVTFETRDTLVIVGPSGTEHRWFCSCGKRGSWKRNKHDAQMGGQFHVQRTKI